MTLQGYMALAGSCLALLSSIVAPAVIVGRYLGGILTTQAAHEKELERLGAGAQDHGRQIESLGRDLSRLEGRFGHYSDT